MICAGIAQGLFAAVAYFLVLLIALRVLRRTDPMFTVLAVALVAYACMFGLLIAAGQIVNFWIFSTSYWFFVLTFLMAFGAIYKSLSLQILLQLSHKPGRQESAEVLRMQYVFGRSYSDRLSLLVERGLVAKTLSGLSLTAEGRALANRVRAAQRAFGIERSG
ncbi:MAG: hypothetical protein AAGA88_00355 [Pseudomonadota bacterium]